MGFRDFQSKENKQKKNYSLLWPNLEFNVEVHIPLLSVAVENKTMTLQTICLILQILQTAGMKDILGIQCKGVDKQQLLSIGSISNCHFMKVFPWYNYTFDKQRFTYICQSWFNYQNKSVACICCWSIIILSKKYQGRVSSSGEGDPTDWKISCPHVLPHWFVPKNINFVIFIQFLDILRKFSPISRPHLRNPSRHDKFRRMEL